MKPNYGQLIKNNLLRLVFMAFVSIFLAIPVKLLWNWVGVADLHLQPISLLHAWGVSFLIRLLWLPAVGQVGGDNLKKKDEQKG